MGGWSSPILQAYSTVSWSQVRVSQSESSVAKSVCVSSQKRTPDSLTHYGIVLYIYSVAHDVLRGAAQLPDGSCTAYSCSLDKSLVVV